MIIAYDPVLKRPACVIIAAAYGTSQAACYRFDARSWLTAPTDNMGRFEVTDDQLDRLVAITAAEMASAWDGVQPLSLSWSSWVY